MNENDLTIQEWRKLIKESFLAQDQMMRLSGMLETGGATKEFEDLFDKMLADATDAASDRYEKTVGQFEEAASAADSGYKREKETLEEKLDRDLAAANDDDEKRDAILDAYFAGADKLMEEHESGLKAAFEQAAQGAL